MANHVGNEGQVKIGSNAIAEIRGWSITETQATVDDTVMGDDWETHKTHHKSWTASANCLWDESDATGQGACTIGASVTLNLYPEGSTSGDSYFTGTATVEKRGASGNHDGLVERTIEFKGNGPLTETTVSP